MTPETGEIVIRPLRADDRPQWEALWRGYLEFYKADLASAVTEATWRRVLDEDGAILGLGAETGSSASSTTSCIPSPGPRRRGAIWKTCSRRRTPVAAASGVA